MNLHRLRLLHHLRAYGTVTATAEALGITVAAASQQLAVLERETGIPLLERVGRTLAFTPAGEVLAAHADVVLADVAAAEADLAGLRDGTRGQVGIAAFPSAGRTLIPRVWRLLRRRAHLVEAPDDHRRHSGGFEDAIVLSFLQAEPDEALAALERRDVDVAVVHSYSLLPRDLPAGCEDTALLDDPVLLALPSALAASLGVARGVPVDLGAFAGLTRWVAPASDSACHEMLRRACGRAGFVPASCATASDFSVIAELVAGEAGAALIPQLALPAQLPEGLSLHPLAEPLQRSILVVTRRGTAKRPDVRTVLAALAEVAEGLQGQCRVASGAA